MQQVRITLRGYPTRSLHRFLRCHQFSYLIFAAPTSDSGKLPGSLDAILNLGTYSFRIVLPGQIVLFQMLIYVQLKNFTSRATFVF